MEAHHREDTNRELRNTRVWWSVDANSFFPNSECSLLMKRGTVKMIRFRGAKRCVWCQQITQIPQTNSPFWTKIQYITIVFNPMLCTVSTWPKVYLPCWVRIVCTQYPHLSDHLHSHNKISWSTIYLFVGKINLYEINTRWIWEQHQLCAAHKSLAVLDTWSFSSADISGHEQEKSNWFVTNWTLFIYSKTLTFRVVSVSIHNCVVRLTKYIFLQTQIVVMILLVSSLVVVLNIAHTDAGELFRQASSLGDGMSVELGSLTLVSARRMKGIVSLLSLCCWLWGKCWKLLQTGDNSSEGRCSPGGLCSWWCKSCLHWWCCRKWICPSKIQVIRTTMSPHLPCFAQCVLLCCHRSKQFFSKLWGWVGLTDADEEGTWVWLDGSTSMSLKVYFHKSVRRSKAGNIVESFQQMFSSRIQELSPGGTQGRKGKQLLHDVCGWDMEWCPVWLYCALIPVHLWEK